MPAGIDQPHAVRPDDTHANRHGNIKNALLQVRTGLVCFSKPGGDDHAAANAGSGALLDRRQKLAGGHSKNRDLHTRCCIGQCRIGRVTPNLLPPRVDRNDATGEAMLDQEVDDSSAELLTILRGAEYRNRTGMQDLQYREPRRAHAGTVD